MTTNIPFSPTRLILLSELPTREKEKYYNLLISANAKFSFDGDGRYVANVRLLAPGRKKGDTDRKRKDASQSNSLMFEERLRRMQLQGFVSVRLEGVDPFDYNTYARFTALISSTDETVRPRSKLLSWLMRLIEEIYDARYAHEAAEIVKEDNLSTEERISTIFPAYVVRRLSMRAGLRTLVDQNCWDLLYNTHIYRRDYLEVEVFARFLQEFYDHDDLLFFLYVRSVVSKLLHVSFKTRWAKNDGPGRQPRSLWMSYRECVSVAKTVFGAANDVMCRDFLSIIAPQLVGQKTETGDTRRIDITQFLHLAVVGYHQTRPSDSMGGAPSGSGMKILPGEVVPMVPTPAPSGGIYMSKYSPYGLEKPLGSGSSISRPDNERQGVIVEEEQNYQGRRFGEDSGHGSVDHEDYNHRGKHDEMYLGLEASSLDAYLNEMQRQRGGAENYDYNAVEEGYNPMSGAEPYYPGDGQHMDLMGLAAAEMPLPSENVADFNKFHAPTESVYSEMSSVLMHREKEFLGYLCQPLENLEESIAEECIEQLADELRAKLTDILQHSVATTAEQFDEELLTVLGSGFFLSDMEASRSRIVSYVQNTANSGVH